MKKINNPRPRAKRRRSFAPDIGLAVLLLSVIATGALIIIAKPFPGIAALFNLGGDSHKAAPAPNAPPQTQPQPTSSSNQSSAVPSSLPSGSAYLVNPKLPLTITRVVDNGVTLVLVEGGELGTRRSPIRQGVSDFVRESGATAGVNGTFFANASLEGTDNLLIGPSLCENETSETMSPFDTKPQLEGRPLVVVSPTSTCIVPYDIASLSLPGAIQSLLPNVTNAFLGGVWLVKNGTASTLDQLAAYNVHDAEDPRRRAFFAIMPDGRPVLGATDGSTTSRHLARALASAGVEEAVLLDSGFSTSLVFQNTILVTGHSTKGVPSRPVPQALVLYGDADPSTVVEPEASEVSPTAITQQPSSTRSVTTTS